MTSFTPVGRIGGRPRHHVRTPCRGILDTCVHSGVAEDLPLDCGRTLESVRREGSGVRRLLARPVATGERAGRASWEGPPCRAPDPCPAPRRDDPAPGRPRGGRCPTGDADHATPPTQPATGPGGMDYAYDDRNANRHGYSPESDSISDRRPGEPTARLEPEPTETATPQTSPTPSPTAEPTVDSPSSTPTPTL